MQLLQRLTELQHRDGYLTDEALRELARAQNVPLHRHQADWRRGPPGAGMPGSVFGPFHLREASANVLTIDALGLYGKIPNLKFRAARIEPAEPLRAERGEK